MTAIPFSEVVERHGPMVWRVCSAVTGPVDADDAWSETFLAALRAYPRLPGDAEATKALDKVSARSLDLVGETLVVLLRRLRAAHSTLPVLVLTGRDGVDDRVAGLDAGADDYVVKPCALSEVLARLRALLRRGGGAGPVLRFADVELDPARGTVTRAGHRLELRPREHALLEYFLRHPDQVLTRQSLYEHVWEHDFDGLSNVLEVYVRYLRTSLEAHGPRLLQTIRGRGYALRRDEEPA